MKITFEWASRTWTADTAAGTSLAIDLDFDGPQPNHFGAPPASRAALQLGGFVGDTEQGGSCNVDTLTVVPHCNGTHTETIAHIVDDDVFVGQAVPGRLLVAEVITLKPENADSVADDYRPPLDAGDRVLSQAALETAWAKRGGAPAPDALIVRTLPNTLAKKRRAYTEADPPPFLTVQAMEWIVEQGFEHFLIDLPSVDRMYDEGLLTNHHLFWNVAEESHQLAGESWREKTISEMIFVPDHWPDGLCLLNLQVPDLFTDAAPSRPIVYPVKEVSQ